MKSIILIFALTLSAVACSKKSSSPISSPDATANIVKDIDATCSGQSCI